MKNGENLGKHDDVDVNRYLLHNPCSSHSSNGLIRVLRSVMNFVKQGDKVKTTPRKWTKFRFAKFMKAQHFHKQINMTHSLAETACKTVLLQEGSKTYQGRNTLYFNDHFGVIAPSSKCTRRWLNPIASMFFRQ